MALCTVVLDTQEGQEGIGEADQMPVNNCRPVGAILILTEPQPLLHVFQPRLNGPASVIRPDDVCGGEFWSACDEPEDLVGRACAREDHVQGAERVSRQPTGIYKAIADLPMRRCEVEGGRAPPPTEVASIAAGFELPAMLEEAAIALACRGKVK